MTTGQPHSPLHLEDLYVGQVLGTPSVRVSDQDVVQFASITHDHNPLHTDPEFAAGTPFGRTVAHGLLGTSLVLGLVHEARYFDGTGLALLGIDGWHFLKPIFPGDELHVRMTITSLRRSQSTPDRGVVGRRLELINQRGEVVQRGDSAMLIRARNSTAGIAPASAGVDAGPRLPVLRDFDDEQRQALESALRDEAGDVLNVFGVLAHHPKLLRRFNTLGGLFLARGVLPPRDRELVILRTAWQVGSHYEYAQHVLIGLRAGLSANEVVATQSVAPADLGRDDRNLVLAVDELLHNDDLADDTWRLLTSRYDARQVLELLMMIGYYRMLAAVLRSVRVPVEPEVERAVREVVPDFEGRSPGWGRPRHAPRSGAA
jgi:acyl dehydratase/alkylhydroperoxidase family enzyme